MGDLTLKDQLLIFIKQGISFDVSQEKLLIKGNLNLLNEQSKEFIKQHKLDIIKLILQRKNASKQNIVVRNKEQVSLLSFAQQRLWLLNQIDGDSAHYNMCGSLRLVGELNKDVLQHAFTTIVERHESLRTCFSVGEDGQPIQLIQEAVPFNVPLIDLSTLTEDKRQLQLTRRTADEYGRVFDLSSDLMLRAQLIKIADDEHVLLVVMHHIASDGWSMSILTNEFRLLYSAYTQAQENPLPPLTIQYADYAHWQRNWLQGEVLDMQLNYWEKQLANLPIVHSLPLDHPRPAIQSFAGATYSSHIDATTTKILNKVCQVQGATLFMGLHAAFSVLLSRYSNETDIVVGSPIANREQAEIAGLIGFFINTLVLRSDLSESPSFNALVIQSKNMLLDAYAHQQVPFEQIVERLQPERSLSHSALFQVMLVLQNNEQGILELPGLTLSPIKQTWAIAKYDLTLTAMETPQGLQLDWEYNTDLFGQETIAQMANHFGLLLTTLVATPNENVFNVDMLDAQERQQLLIDWNSTHVDYPNDKCIHELFEAQVESNPNAIAVIFENQALSYQQLNEKANQLAHYLINEKQIKPDTLVGICVERSLDMVVGILAILKAGGAYVPLDPEYPEARLKYMLDDAQLTTVLTQSHLRETTPVSDAQAVCLDSDEIKRQLQTQSIQNPTTNESGESGLTANHLAYVIYTSGSTGNPKGVMIQHSNTVAFLSWAINTFSSAQLDCVLASTSVCFDLSVFEMFAPLSMGGSLLVVKDILALGLYQGPHAISLINTVPSAAEALLAGGFIPASVNTINLAGEPLKQKIVDRLYEVGVASVYDLYGPSEDTTYSTFVLRTHGGTSSIGRPIHNSQVYLMNPSGQLVGKGLAGELHIGGVGLARGYLHRPDLTAEKFIANPFYDKTNLASSERLYKTGDLVRWLPDGNLEYLGRIDHQVKIRGFRIELGEIENTLSSHAAVMDAVVLAKESPVTGDKRLVAYVVTGQQDNPDENNPAFIEQLRHHLSQTLPDYMVPSAFVLLDSLPLTPNGKVDRKALPEPDFAAQQNVYVAPTTETEKILCEIWQEVLGVERVGITDNFFQLGGHSLLIMQVIARLQQQGLVMTARQLFTTTSLGDLAIALDTSGNHRQPLFMAPANLIPEDCQHITPDMLPLVELSTEDIALIVDKVPGGVANVQDIYRLGPLQEGILFHHMMATQGDAYVLPALFKMDNRKVVTDFIEALQFIINRHDALRTAVFWNGLSVPVQVVCRHAELPVTWLELDASATIEAQMRACCEPGKQWIDLGQAPLLQLQIAVDPDSQQHYVLLQFHHIISDHVGLEIIQKELALYQAGQSDNLPAPTPYREFVAHAQHQALHNNAKDFFSGMLGDVEEPTAPFDVRDVNGDGSRIVEAKAVIPASVSGDVRRIAKDLKVSPAALFHTAWAMVIAACSGRDDVVFGTVLSGRLQGTVGAEHMLGVFINTLPLRVKLQGSSVASAVHQIQDSLLNLLPYEQNSLALAQRCSSLPAGSPLFTAMFNYRHSKVETVEDATTGSTAATNSGAELLIGQERTNYPFNLSVDDFGDGFGLDVQIDQAIDAVRVLGYVQTAVVYLVEALQHTPEQPITSLSILPKAERQQLLIDWNNTQVDYPNDKCIHELFEAQVESNPNAIAVIFENQALSYQQLNEKANQLAHYLINEKQIKPDTLVGICVERSLDMVVGILAILKAGGAYVPLDPEYPEARLKYMLDDAQLTTVLTQSHLRETTPVSDAQAVCLDSDEIKRQLQTQSIQNPTTNESGESGLTANHLAYVIYTSGSTGNPKGVMIQHSNTVAFLSWAINTFSSAQLDCVLASTSVCFDLSVFEMFAPLSMGGSLLVVKDILALGLYQGPHAISLINTVPSAAEALLAGGFIPASVNTINLAGEPLKQKIVDRLYEVGVASVYDLYGPSEDTTYSTFVLRTHGGTSSIGRPIHNSQVYLMNPSGQLVGKGLAGELHIGGVGLARGYLHRPDLTAEKFIANPFYDKTNLASSERLYKTGDLVRWLPDGNLEYLGRIDHQVKIRGFRIELGEIENTLSSHAAVMDAVVLAKESPVTGDKRLVAYVVTGQQDNPDENNPAFIEQLRHHLSQTLPDYMVPSAFVLLDSLPLTPNGKVDRKALPEPDFAAQQNVYVAPTTETEKILCEIWQEVLGVERVGLTDNFFQLGGHSLLIMQVISKLQQQSVSMTARQLFSTPSLGDLAIALDASGNHGQPLFKAPANLIPEDCQHITPDMLPLVDLSPAEIAHITGQVPGGVANVQDIYPLGPLQEGILFHHMMATQGDVYILPSLFKLNSRDAVTDLIGNLQFIINRHDALRTAIIWQGLSVPVQVVCRSAELPVTWLELDSSQPIETQMRARCEPGKQWMDLGQAPLLQLQVAVDPASGQHYVLLQFHHIISDHVGLEIIQKELVLYQAGQGDHLPAAVPYREFVAHAQHQALHNDAEAFFTQTLGDVEEPTAPFDLRDVNGDGSRIVEVKARVPNNIARQIRHISKDLKVSPAALFHTTWAMVVAACSGRDDVVFGTVLSGRLQGTVGAEHMLGVFINTLPLRVKLHGSSVTGAVCQVQNSLLDLLPYEQSSLSLAQSCSGLPAGTPLFTAMLNYRHSLPAEPTRQNAGVEFLSGQERTNYPFNLSVDDLGNGFELDVQVDPSIDAGRVLNYVQTAIAELVNALTTNPDLAVSSLSILPEAERQQLLTGWNNTQTDYPSDKFIHELFEAQVENNPTAIAATFENQTLSYQHLNEKANQLAHYLITEKNVTPDTLVGICVARSLDMLIGILAILKAGGAYVPLDPEYPEARLKYMLEDAKLTTVLTQSHLRETTPVSDGQAVYLDDEKLQHQLLIQPITNPDARSLGESGLTPNHLAYVIYTSGSTGNPKGVLAPHRSIYNRVSWMEQQFPALPDDVFCQKTAAGFVDHVAEIFQALAYGKHLVVVRTSDTLDADNFIRIVAQHQITRLTLVPSLLKFLIQQGTLAAMPSLRLVISSGEALQLEETRSFYRALPGTRLLNLYGSSEIGADVTAYLIDVFDENPNVMQYFLDPVSPDTHTTVHKFTYQSPPSITENLVFRSQYSDSSLPQRAIDYQAYVDELSESVLPFSVDVAAQRFIGHMTSKLPSFIPELSRLITQLNQNMVKVETSNNLTLIERQVLAIMHRLFFQLPTAFYDTYCQDPLHVFGMVTGGGSVANLTALWCARNRGLLALGASQADINRMGAHRLLQQYGFKGAVILGSRLMHYSMRKSAAVMGLGEEGIMYVEQDANQKMSMTDLQRCIAYCHAEQLFIIAIVGIAGATETGTVDPLGKIAVIARQHQLHFHADAAWGGAFQLSQHYRHLLSGIELADSITFCPHKQLYLSQGISLCLLRDTQSAASIATHAAYQSQKGSYDLGQFSVEGSRPAHALLLHASLHLLGQHGYSWLIEQGMSKTRYFTHMVKNSACFELIGYPDLNIITYRYIPIALRANLNYSSAEQKQLSEAVFKIQQRQFALGTSFVSKTTIQLASSNGEPITVFRIVLSNPLTQFDDLREVLVDQLRIANELIEVPSDHHHNQLAGLSSDMTTTYAKWQVPIGKPIAHTQVMILDTHTNLVPFGAYGELHVGGAGLARGYLNRADLTAEKFITNPFYNKTDSSSSERLYKTGDLVRWLPNGNLEYLGRIDHQVKIRGFRIELGEIENTLISSANVKDALVMAKESSTGDKHLVAYIVADGLELSDDSSIATAHQSLIDNLRHHLGETLPDYMVPAAFMVLPSFPLNPNGKVDRKALPEPNTSAQQNSYIAPRTAIEQTVCNIWQEILKVDSISVTDNFFQLGGNSLIAARLVRKINVNIDEHFKINHIFQFQTIEKIAHIITQNLLANPKIENEKQDFPVDYVVPVDKLSYKNKPLNVIAHYTNSMFLDIQSSAITHDLLQHAFSLLITMHPILNSQQYMNTEGDLVHTFRRTNELFNVIYKDFTATTKQDVCDDPWLNCDEYITTLPSSCFTFTENDHLFKAYLFNCGENYPRRLLIIWHHHILDGFSTEIVMNDLDEILSSLLENGRYDKQKYYPSITEWYDVINANAKSNQIEDLHYWKNQPWDEVKSLPQDKQLDDFTANTAWADETTLTSMQSLWQEGYASETTRKCLEKAMSANRLSIEKTKALYSSIISQQGINAFDVILLAISRAFSTWTETNITLLNIINSGRGLIFPEFDNTKTIGEIAFYTPLLVNSNIDTQALLLLRKIHEERQNLPKLALSYKWNKNILELPEYAGFPQSQIVINYDTGNRYEADKGLNLGKNNYVTPGYHNEKYQNNSPELIAKDRIYIFIDIKDGQLFCQIDISGYNGGVIYKNPCYHPSRVFTLGRDVITELEKIMDELIQ